MGKDSATDRVFYKLAYEQWTVTHAPAANTQATASKAAGGANQRHHCTAIVASFAAGATAGAAVKVNLRDGATGAGTVLASFDMTCAIAGSQQLVATGIDIPGTANTAMTLEFAAAGGATTLETVTMVGYTDSFGQ